VSNNAVGTVSWIHSIKPVSNNAVGTVSWIHSIKPVSNNAVGTVSWIHSIKPVSNNAVGTVFEGKFSLRKTNKRLEGLLLTFLWCVVWYICFTSTTPPPERSKGEKGFEIASICLSKSSIHIYIQHVQNSPLVLSFFIPTSPSVRSYISSPPTASKVFNDTRKYSIYFL